MGAVHENSWYASSANWQTDCPTFDGNQTFDVCVLGAGITGLSAALNLAEAGFSVCVLEAMKIGWGASGRSGGQIIFGFGAEQPTIEQLVGKHDAQKIWQAGIYGIDLLKARIRKHDIQCDLTPGHLHLALKPRQAKELAHWQQSLEKDYGYGNLEYWSGDKLRSELNSSAYLAGLYDPNSGHLHPLNYTLGLAKAAQDAGVQIFENSRITAIEPGQPVKVKTDSGKVSAKYLLMAGNAYLHGLAPKIESKVMPVGTYICATEPLGEDVCRSLIPRNLAAADINFVLDYYRCSNDHRMLFGGRVSYSTLPPRDLESAMRARMLAIFPQLADVKVDYAWGGYVGITMNRTPDFGRVSDNIFYAHGFSGHGIAATGLAGKLMSEAIQGNAEGFDLFSRIPHMPFPGGRVFRTPALVLAMAWYRLMDLRP